MQDNLQDLLHHQDGDSVHSNLRHELQHGPPDGLQAGESLFKTDILVLIYYYFVKDCKTIPDVECRIVNIDKHGKYTPKVKPAFKPEQHYKIYFQKICTDVPTQKCIPIPVKVEAEKCVNIPTQSCENVPVVASVPVPSKQCFRKPR